MDKWLKLFGNRLRFHVFLEQISHRMASVLGPDCLIANFCNMGLSNYSKYGRSCHVSQIVQKQINTQSSTATLPVWGISIKIWHCYSQSVFYLSVLTWSEKVSHHEATLSVHMCMLDSVSELRSASVSIFYKVEKFQFDILWIIVFKSHIASELFWVQSTALDQ